MRHDRRLARDRRKRAYGDPSCASASAGIRRRSLWILLATVIGTAGCAVNPVTGERELALISTAEEVAIGDAQYVPARQMQGGDYVRDPALTAYVSSVGQRVAAVSDRNLPYEFVVLASSVPNAWALPGGKIAINRGLLLELESEAELAAVLGHEIVHAAARHGALAMQRGLLLQGAVLAAAVASRNNDYSALAVGAAGLGAELINMRHGREAELESDRYGMQYMARAGYDPAAAIDLQETFVRLSQGRPEPGWLAGLFASHPPSMERVAANRATAAALATSGERGRERYVAAIADAVATRPAYDAHDRGRAALRDGDLAAARTAAQEALRLVSDEGHFYALLGDIELAAGGNATPMAVQRFADAIDRNRSYFYYHLRKGVAHQRLDQLAEAQSAFLQSLSLLPTADAYLGLGQIAEARGDRAAALAQYRQAAESSGAAGEAARDAVVRLDLPANPGQYIAVGAALDNSGRLQVAVQNPTRQAIRDVTVLIRYTDPQDGSVANARRTIAGPIAPGATQRLATGLGPFASDQAYQVTVEAAGIVSD